MSYFDRFDICEAYLAVEYDWNRDGWVPERPHRAPGDGRESIDVQLSRIGFKPSALFSGYDSLSDNGKEIYDAACERWGLSCK